MLLFCWTPNIPYALKELFYFDWQHHLYPMIPGGQNIAWYFDPARLTCYETIWPLGHKSPYILSHSNYTCFVLLWGGGGSKYREGGQNIVTIFWPRGQYLGGSKYRLTPGHPWWRLNTLRQRHNGCHFAVGIFDCIFLNENIWISNKASLKYVS